MTWRTLAVGGLILSALFVKWRAQREQSMSIAWLNEQERQAIRQSAQIESVVWRWPIQK